MRLVEQQVAVGLAYTEVRTVEVLVARLNCIVARLYCICQKVLALPSGADVHYEDSECFGISIKIE